MLSWGRENFFSGGGCFSRRLALYFLNNANSDNFIFSEQIPIVLLSYPNTTMSSRWLSRVGAGSEPKIFFNVKKGIFFQ
ncbi:hypothetical protein B9S53_05360 [Arthrospira sp. O9.13F]|nr:hypothetical protein B9S53_05360 [Arthrospira sp. O9.13F]